MNNATHGKTQAGSDGKAVVRADLLRDFPELFGVKTVNGRTVDIEDAVFTLAGELHPLIAAALTARKELLAAKTPVRKKYAWPAWDETFEDPVSGGPWSFRHIVEGLIDNFLGRESSHSWRLNDEVPVPRDADPLQNPGLELTGPWQPIDMAFNALNSSAPMNMPDFEDASPAHFRPDGSPASAPVGIFAAIRNAKEIFEGAWEGKTYEVVKKGRKRSYTINKPSAEWPTRFARPPGLHVRFDHITVNGEPVHGIIVIALLWAACNYDSLSKAGTGVYYYIPKIQTPHEALVVEKLLSRIEEMIGVKPGTFKIKVLYEEGNGGRFLPAIAWTFRRRLLGTNVGRWDYLASLIEMWKDDPQGVFPDPQSIGMASPNMIAYQRYNALMMLMAGMKEGKLRNGAPIGGMAAVMIYQAGDSYGRAKYNVLALRAMGIDKLRERLLGLIFMSDEPLAGRPTLDDILRGKVKGRLYDTYRQSWVASPEPAYVAAGNGPLQAPVEKLQSLVDAPLQSTTMNGVPTVDSGLSPEERRLFESRGLLNAEGRITPWIGEAQMFGSAEGLLSTELWESIYAVPDGDITIERVQHAFYMAANYGFQILNGNFAAAIDDYELRLRFMNDLATYRIDVSWLWTLVRHQARFTKPGRLKLPELTADGVFPAKNGIEVAAGTPFTRELFESVWEYHNRWTHEFFAELDRQGDSGRFDRSKAPIIMDLLKSQLLSPVYIQHSARVLFVIAQAGTEERRKMLDAFFALSRAEVAGRVKAGSLPESTLSAYDYVHDIFPQSSGTRT